MTEIWSKSSDPPRPRWVDPLIERLLSGSADIREKRKVEKQGVRVFVLLTVLLNILGVGKTLFYAFPNLGIYCGWVICMQIGLVPPTLKK